MRIWFIQSREAWEHLNKAGFLESNRHHSENSWPHAYDWMRDQLAKRVGEPVRSDAMPLWGWYQWCNVSKRPDLRLLRHHWGPEGNHVMIECELPDGEVLLSDHDAWHITLNDSYLPLNVDDDQQFGEKLRRAGWQAGSPKPDHLLPEIQKSWERIFDLEALGGEYWGPMESKSIQASFWRIELSQVKSHKPFTSKFPKRRR